MRKWVNKTFATLAVSAAAIGFAGAAQATVIVTAGTPGTTGQTALYVTDPAALSVSDPTATAAEIADFLGAPDDVHTGLGEHWVQYDLGIYSFFDGAGNDFNIYELNGGTPEWAGIDVLVSADGIKFFNVESAFGDAIDLAGDEAHNITSGAFRRSFDVGGAVTALGASQFRYLRIQGTGGGSIGGSNDFDLDAVGFANFTTGTIGVVPEPATWAMMILGFGAALAMMRRHRAALA